MSLTKRSRITPLSVDKALGAVGGGLAAASLGFGVYMNVHGPVASFGHSQDFTVYAQLMGPRPPKGALPQEATPPGQGDALDLTATASIAGPSRVGSPTGGAATADADSTILTSITLEAAGADAAMIVVGGRTLTIHVGDIVPGAGEVLEIRPGSRPLVKTSRGLIVSLR